MSEEQYKESFKCPICNGNKTKKLYDRFPGYVDKTYFDIYKCDECKTQFIIAPDTLDELYNAIYSLDCIPGYDRYKKYAVEIIKQTNPFNYLSKQESAYRIVFDYINDVQRKNIRILEVGSGLGYLTYALNRAGYPTTGIDTSEYSVEQAKIKFGDYFINSDLKNFSQNTEDKSSKYDLIIATELIEHVTDPVGFIRDCMPLLSNQGGILLTTPNYYFENTIWDTESPPVHRFWFSKKTFEVIADILDLNVSFPPDNYSNLIISYLQTLKNRNGFNLKPPFICEDLSRCCPSVEQFKTAHHPYIRKLLYSEKIKNLMNFTFKKFVHFESTLGVVLKRKWSGQT
jgi:2-polyprenyl-3-methyl-5-hydroxy-6-metoxy-1,4-benzoquinol methylase